MGAEFVLIKTIFVALRGPIMDWTDAAAFILEGLREFNQHSNWRYQVVRSP